MMPKSSIKITPMEIQHVTAVAEIEKICFSSPWSEQMIIEELQNDCARYLVAMQGEIVVGYIGVQIILDEGYITNIAVKPDIRRCGIGSLLLESMAELARMMQLAFLTLEVRFSNISAIALYEKFGFKRVGARPRYYSDPVEDAILMTKWFESRSEV